MISQKNTDLFQRNVHKKLIPTSITDDSAFRFCPDFTGTLPIHYAC